jgi:hypothetical protein
MPTRPDLQRLVEWCDRQPPFGWLSKRAGIALSVHSIIPTGTTRPPATGLWAGEVRLRGAPGISELPDEPVRFVGTLTGVRNPSRQAELTIEAGAERVVAKLTGSGVHEAWAAGLVVQHVREEDGLIRADWTFGDAGVGAAPPPGFDFPQVFDLLAWPDMRVGVLNTGPP